MTNTYVHLSSILSPGVYHGVMLLRTPIPTTGKSPFEIVRISLFGIDEKVCRGRYQPPILSEIFTSQVEVWKESKTSMWVTMSLEAMKYLITIRENSEVLTLLMVGTSLAFLILLVALITLIT